MNDHPAVPEPAAGQHDSGGWPGRAPLDAIPDHLGASAERLLIGVSVYREPADRNAVLFQVGRHDWTAARVPDRRGPAPPPYQAPADLAAALASCEASGLVIMTGSVAGGTAADGHTVFVEPGTASELHRLLTAAGRGAELRHAHRRAADYWQWRSAAWPQGRRADIHDVLEARHHLFAAGESEQASAVTETVCAQLHAWGDLAREVALIHETLGRLPARSAGRAAWIHELGGIAAVRADYADAEYRYQQALDMFAAVGDRPGVARSYHSLGILAQAQGDYAKAERRYQQSSDTAGEPASGEHASGIAGPVAASSGPADLAAASAALSESAVTPARAALPQSAATSASAMPPDRAATPASTAPAGRANQPASADGPSIAAAPPAAKTPVPASTAGAAAWPVSFAAADKHRPRQASGGNSGWRLPGVAAVGLAASALALSAFSAFQISGVLTSAPGARLSAAWAGNALAARQQTATWIKRHAIHSAIVACDPAMCQALQQQGMSTGSLIDLGPSGSADPLGSNLVVATPAVRNLFGARLASVYAPVVMASFGTGTARIQVRVVGADGSAAYLRALHADLRERRAAGAQLLTNRRISVAGTARRQLARGQVDARLLITIPALAHMRPLQIISFATCGPGASSAVPLDTAEVTGSGHGSDTAYLHAMLLFLHQQWAPFLAASVQQVPLGEGRTAVRIDFGEPGKLGLLGSASTAVPISTHS